MSKNQTEARKVALPISSDEEPWEYLPIGVVVIAFIVLTLFFFGYQGGKEPAGLGPTGDWFGGFLNPLIAFLALVGLLRSLVIQRETLRKTTQGLNDQISLQRKQASRQTFFDLLNLRATAVNAIAWIESEQLVKGRSATKAILKTLEAVARDIKVEEIQDDLDLWQVPQNCPGAAKPYIALFATFYSGNPLSDVTSWSHFLSDKGDGYSLSNLESELGHVFRATYQVLKFTYECSDFSEKEKQDLANYLRAQMSEDEFALFALTALTSIGKKSRAAAIAFDLYEDRLYSIPWATELRDLFERSDLQNQKFAAECGYPVLDPGRSPC
jgi:hypothetical protein